MKYFTELKRSMEYLASNPKTVFLGQAVAVPGTAMSTTLKDVKKNKLIELPVTEEMQMGITTGMLMNGLTPISIYPRWNFLILAMNQLVNHLDKLNEMTNNYYKSKAIIRTSIGAQRPLHPQSQHVGDFTNSIQMMSKNIHIVKLKEPKDIFPAYKKALDRKDNISSIMVEYGDYYSEK
jgi:pyruvate/2-oxoglutarate/acetoin dehydrogenase E1 component|tara:strand:- start:161 stop:697 length:537 start_codon:yes stop_codon:yes gene_type:complete